MPLLRYPVPPLTRTGRMLLSAAAALFAAVLTMAWSPAQAADSEALPAESPHFFVNSGNPGEDRLPLKSTDVDVRIAGVIADVTVKQRYRNEGTRPIEARYVFPGSTGAAVYGMNVRLGDRLLTAHIEEKKQARKTYEAAKRSGKTTALLEQQRPNVFEMNVANILPGDDVEVELRYTELLSPEDARYGFVFPTVVGPRYHSTKAGRQAGGPVALPYLKPGEESAQTLPPLQLKLAIDAPVAVKEVTSPSHDIELEGTGTRHVRATLKASAGRPANNRDFILQYRMAGDRVESGLMLFRGEGENFFLGLIEPPRAVAPQKVNPRDYIFVIDISGSMQGQPLDTAKTLLRDLIGGLRPSDTFNVMLFSGSQRMLSPESVPATPANIARAMEVIDTAAGGGSTEVVPALRAVYNQPKANAVSRSVIVITDGYVTVESEVFQLIRRNLGNANVFAFGIGSSVNRHLIEGMARAGQGEAFIVTRPDEAKAQADRLRKMIDSPVLTQVKLRWTELDAYDVEPAALPDVLGGRPVVVFGKWKGDPSKAKLMVQGEGADGVYRLEVAAADRVDNSSAALRYLWARQRIAALSDQEAIEGGRPHKEAITQLGLKYSLLTEYTSFVAVDKVVRRVGAEPAVPVDQPSPLPEGVTAAAVGANVPSTPEPAAWMALLLTLGIVVATVVSRRRRR